MACGEKMWPAAGVALAVASPCEGGRGSRQRAVGWLGGSKRLEAVEKPVVKQGMKLEPCRGHPLGSVAPIPEIWICRTSWMLTLAALSISSFKDLSWLSRCRTGGTKGGGMPHHVNQPKEDSRGGLPGPVRCTSVRYELIPGNNVWRAWSSWPLRRRQHKCPATGLADSWG